LKESDVIGWVKSACDAQSDERMKVDAIEKRMAEKCAAQIEKAKTKSTGMPW